MVTMRGSTLTIFSKNQKTAFFVPFELNWHDISALRRCAVVKASLDGR
jgi:hypothetical protein